MRVHGDILTALKCFTWATAEAQVHVGLSVRFVCPPAIFKRLETDAFVATARCTVKANNCERHGVGGERRIGGRKR